MTERETAVELWRRIIRDSGNVIDRYRAIHMVAEMMGRDPVVIASDAIGWQNIEAWQPTQ